MLETFNKMVEPVNSLIWSNPIVFLILGSAIWFTIRMHFVQVRNLKHQFSLLFKKNESLEGISPFEAFCTVVGYRVGTANIAGVAVAVFSGGPGAVLWMLITSILDAAISYAECALGQVYKIKQDGEYRGGAYYYIERGMGLKGTAIIYALLTLICVPILTVAPHANSISKAFNNSIGLPLWVSGIVVGIFLLWTVFGGIKRIARINTYLVPVMTGLYLLMTVIVLVADVKHIPAAIGTIVSSAFGTDAIFGGLLGTAVLWGVKRSVNSSGAGMGEAVPAAAATDCKHPGSVGLVNSFSVFIDVIVCICTGIMIVLTDCFNVKDAAGKILHLGKGSAVMAQQAADGEAGIVWAQEAIGTVLPTIGGLVLAFCLLFFAFTAVLNYYYQGETSLAFIFRNSKQSIRKTAILILRILMPICFFIFAIQSSGASFAIGEVGVGIMVWFNVIILLINTKKIIAIYKDYTAQLKSGIDAPIFNPEKLGIKNADLWMEINAKEIAEQNQSKE